MNRPFGIGDFLLELKEASFKGDTPGHPFRGNQFSGGSGNARAEFENHPAIVKRAITEGITDLGQLSPEDKKHLESHVKKGTLIKTQNYLFPKPKTKYQPSIDYMKSLGINR